MILSILAPRYSTGRQKWTRNASQFCPGGSWSLTKPPTSTGWHSEERDGKAIDRELQGWLSGARRAQGRRILCCVTCLTS